MKKKLLIINAHPDKESYNYALSRAFVSALDESIWHIDVINLTDLEFNPILQYGYRKRTEFEPDLVDAVQKLKDAQHLVWFFPMWWYGIPALLKGFIDRTFLPGISFAYEEGNPIPKKLWKGKTAHIIMTADSPWWYNRFFIGSPATKQFKRGTLQFCGVNPVKVTYISPIRNSSEKFRKDWLEKVRLLGQKTV